MWSPKDKVPSSCLYKEKYLGLMLDRKLNWKLNVNERVRKALIAFLHAIIFQLKLRTKTLNDPSDVCFQL